jgi:hypothetical protein
MAALAMCALLSTTFAAAEPQRGGGGGGGQRVAVPRDGGGGPVGPAQPGGPSRQPGPGAGGPGSGPGVGHPIAPGGRPGYGGPYYGARGSYVFVGGYYYDPFYGPYPWWPASAYWGYYPVFDYRAELRILATPREATVYVDGFYAGLVDDFDGTFQRLPLTPGGHRIELYLEGHRTVRRSMYLQPGSTMKIRETLVPLAAGEVAEPPELAPAVPPPPEGTYTEPNGRAERALPPPARRGRTADAEGYGTLALRVQPAEAEVSVDGQRWLTSGNGEFEIQLPAGRHRIEVTLDGFQRFSADVDVPDEGPTPLNISLTRSR